MDAGADVGARDLEPLLAAGGAPEGLSPVATLAVVDELLNREALWHGGHFLQQTVYSCLYMLQPARRVVQAPLAIFSGCCMPPASVVHRQAPIMEGEFTSIGPSVQGDQQPGAVSVLRRPARQRQCCADGRPDGPCVRGMDALIERDAERL